MKVGTIIRHSDGCLGLIVSQIRENMPTIWWKVQWFDKECSTGNRSQNELLLACEILQ